MGSGGAGFAGAGGVGGGTLAATEFDPVGLVVSLPVLFDSGVGALELDGAAELVGAAELFATVGAGFESLVADVSAADASGADSDFFSDSFFFEPAEITIDTTWSFWTSAKPKLVFTLNEFSSNPTMVPLMVVPSFSFSSSARRTGRDAKSAISAQEIAHATFERNCETRTMY
jgi:hypothetical protein